MPRTIDELLALPGVARKTANVVLGTAYGIADGRGGRHPRAAAGAAPGAHPRSSTPQKIEQELMKVIPREHWIRFSHQLIWHGRRVCFARKPDCAGCLLAPHCPSAFLE